MKESEIQKKIIDYLESCGAFVVKTMLANKSGIPDIIACYEGRFIAIEVKTEIGEVTPLQLHKLFVIRKAGGIGIMARSVDDVKKLMRTAFGVDK